MLRMCKERVRVGGDVCERITSLFQRMELLKDVLEVDPTRWKRWQDLLKVISKCLVLLSMYSDYI